MSLIKKMTFCMIVSTLITACGGGGGSSSSESPNTNQSNLQQNSNSFDVSTWDNFVWE